MATENGALATGLPEEKPGIILVDLDATMAHYAGWDGGKIGRILPGVKETLARLRAAGHKVLVWTTRGDHPDVRAWLVANAIDYDGFYPAVKPMDLALIIDDRAFRAENAGLDAERVLASIKPAWRIQKEARS